MNPEESKSNCKGLVGSVTAFNQPLAIPFKSFPFRANPEVYSTFERKSRVRGC